MKKLVIALLLLTLLQTGGHAQQIHKAPAPLFRDPIYDGAADPVVVYNREKKQWWMFYTQRRANVQSAGVAFCYGTNIGVAVTDDHGQSWSYHGAPKLEFEEGVNTFWAPDIFFDEGIYHMFVAYIRGVRNNWGGKAHIVHFTSKDLWNWTFKDSLKLISDNVIDPTFLKLPDGKWHVWYKDDYHSITMTAESGDLVHWRSAEKPAIGGAPHEGPKIFQFSGWYWMITDEWHGQRVYRSKDAITWEKQGLVLDKNGVRPDDSPTGAHADVVVVGDKSYIFYFTHPGRKTHGEATLDKDGDYPYSEKRSSIQVAELVYKDGTLVAVRDEPFDFWLPDLEGQSLRADDPQLIHRSIKEVTDVMVHDIFSPPVASRIYAYMTVAGYEAARQGNTAFASFAGTLHALDAVPAPEAGKKYDFSLSAVEAVLKVGKTLVISEDQVEDFRVRLLADRKAILPADVYTNSVEYGDKVAAHVLAWAGKDHYKETRALAKYDPGNDAATWKPTPPAYMKAVEPHWSKMRTFVIDSARQFIPHPPTPFSQEKGSPFYKDAMEVYEAGLQLTEEQRWIANFWDCNPFKMNVNGHLMFATKKISPGGHWINITSVACQKAGSDVVRSLQAYAWVSVVIADAFISCWDEKYRSNAIRPETYINQYISQDWMPLLQTPPFPEYTSGHSVVSACAAVVLTRLFGEHFAFADSTEVEFGLPPRSFTSFQHAAEEAAISRFYGGIHFKPAIAYGLEEGRKIGEFVAARMHP